MQPWCLTNEAIDFVACCCSRARAFAGAAEPQPMRAVVASVDLPPAYAGTLAAYAVLIVEEDDGIRSTLYMPYLRPDVPLPGQRCSFNVGPGFVKDLVGREFWTKEREVTFVLQSKCDTAG